jgi:hypothetical protein
MSTHRRENEKRRGGRTVQQLRGVGQPTTKGAKLIVTLPLPPKELQRNSRAPWQAVARKTKKCRMDAGIGAIAARNEQQFGKVPFASATYILKYYFSKRGDRDPDNLIGWAKASLDALQDAGIVVNDSVLIPKPPEQYYDRKNPRLEIHLEGDLLDEQTKTEKPCVPG